MYFDLDTQRIYQQELAQQAEMDRLAREVLEDQHKAGKASIPALAWIGHQMMSLGSALISMSGEKKDAETVYNPDIHLN